MRDRETDKPRETERDRWMEGGRERRTQLVGSCDKSYEINKLHNNLEWSELYKRGENSRLIVSV